MGCNYSHGGKPIGHRHTPNSPERDTTYNVYLKLSRSYDSIPFPRFSLSPREEGCWSFGIHLHRSVFFRLVSIFSGLPLLDASSHSALLPSYKRRWNISTTPPIGSSFPSIDTHDRCLALAFMRAPASRVGVERLRQHDTGCRCPLSRSRPISPAERRCARVWT